jgi:hypothetical protein
VGDTIPTDFGAGNTLAGTTVNFQFLGLLSADGTQINPAPAIGFNSAFPYDFDPSNGVDTDKFDFEGRAVHEIGHTLGLISRVGVRELNPTEAIAPSVWDLFRFRPGVTLGSFFQSERLLRAGGEHIFYAGSGAFPLSTARSDGTGGDGSTASHWKADELLPESPDRVAIGVMEPTARLGERLIIKAPDVLALDVMNRIFLPEPAGGCEEQEPNERVPPFSPISVVGASCRGQALSTDTGGITVRYGDGTTDAIEDLWEFTLIDPRGMQITLLPTFEVESQSADDFDLFLLRIAGTSITSVGNSATDSAIEHIETPPLQAGTYFIGVSAQTGGGSYRLLVNSTARAIAEEERRRRPATRR